MNSDAVRRLLRAIHTPGLGLTAFQMLVLAELAHRPGITMLELGRRCRRPGRGIEKPIHSLRKAGFIGKTQAIPYQPNAAMLTVTALGMEVLRGLELAVTEPKSNTTKPCSA